MSLRIYLRGPRVLYAMGPRPGAEIVPVPDAQWQQAPARVREEVDAAARALASLGFDAPTRGASAQKNVSSCFALLERADGEALAAVAVMLTASGRISTTVIFQSELADGTRVATGNGATKRRFPRQRGWDSISFPEVRDVGALHALHALRVRTLAAGSAPRRITRGADPIAHYRGEEADFQARMVAAGYYRAAPDGRHALTRRGAAFVTWRGLFPWAHVSDWRDERRRQVWRRAADVAA